MSKTFVFFLLISSSICSQYIDSESVNLQKYWYYRWRFQNDFTFFGEGQGRSLPIQCRQGVRWSRGIEVVDATIYLGVYWAVLATENRLLRLNQQWDDLEKNKTELYYALKAYERLDSIAEPFLGLTSKIDGFFIRDDVPGDFIDSLQNKENYRHFNQGKTSAPGTNSVYQVITSDYYNSGNPGTDSVNFNDPPEMSQDQVIWLCMGALFIERSLPQGIDTVELLNGQKISFDFVGQAKRFATNMINYCRFKYPINAQKENWKIYNPRGELVWPGQNAFIFKYPFYVLGKMLYTPSAENNQYFDKPKGKGWWNLTKVWIPRKNVNGQMIGIMAILSNSWGKNAEKTRDKIYKEFSPYGWADYYMMLLNYLHQTPIKNKICFDSIEYAINTAPICGPYLMNNDIFLSYTQQNNLPPLTFGWTRHLRYSSQPNMIQHPENDIYTYRGFYAGLDYMLLYNLYCLTRDKPLPKYQNLIDRTIDDQSILQKHNQPLDFCAFNSVNVKCTHRPLQTLSVHIPQAKIEGLNPSVSNRFPLQIIQTPLNVWENMKNKINNYGWNEKFFRVNHYQLRIQ